jgi:hypothetical protein
MSSLRSRLEKLEASLAPMSCVCKQPRRVCLLVEIDGQLVAQPGDETPTPPVVCTTHGEVGPRDIVLCDLKPEAIHGDL